VASAVIRVRCADPGCPAETALICGVMLPPGWGEVLGDFNDTGGWVPSDFWCPAHAAAHCQEKWIA
jgi:hypothetical protein